MRYYVTINGVSSLTIPGLAIRELPSISKTLMRNQKETIDGRDGDIITELGYSAYDKTLEIGLFGTYDINQIIAFFNQKGTIVFSDEDDKYYNFTILDQIDYDRLVKFRTASVRIHCQPFKYPLTETPVEVTPELLTGEGSNITLDNTDNWKLGLGLKGDTYQYSTTGKNLFDLSSNNLEASWDGGQTGKVTIINDTTVKTQSAYVNWRAKSINIPLAQASTQYTLTLTLKSSTSTVEAKGYVEVWYYNGSSSARIQLDGNNYYKFTSTTTASITFTTPADLVNLGLSLNVGGSDVTKEAIYENIMLQTGATATDYEPYTGGIASPNPTYPQDIEVVTGGQNIKVYNENLFSIQDLVKGRLDNGVIGYETNTTDLTLNTDSFSFTTNNNYRGVTSGYIEVKPQTDYVYSQGTQFTGLVFVTACYDKNKTYLGPATYNGIDNYSRKYTMLANTQYFRINIQLTSSGTTTIDTPRLSEGNTPTDYIPHQEQNYEINLGTTELCKIGTYQDYIYKSGADWKIHREIGKVTLDGSESGWDYFFSTNGVYILHNNY